MTLPVTVDEVINYLKLEEDGHEVTEDERAEVESALEAEAAAQGRKCRVDDPIQPDVREALFRRVARNLALRNLPLMVLRGDAESGDTVPPGADPEIRRLEAPHRKVLLG